MRTIGVVTSARSDYGIYRPLLRAITSQPDLGLWLFVTGMHLAPAFGHTVDAIERDGFPIVERIQMMLASDDPEGIAMSLGLGTVGFAQAFGRRKPDLLILLGDRFEMLAAASAALPFNIPIAHIHGGESTEGLIDEAIRHALTKMSHLHFVSTQAYARRVAQMGEGPERIHVSGAPGLDNVNQVPLLGLDAINQLHGCRIKKPFLLVTHHPVTLEPERTETEVDELLAALEISAMSILFSRPNADTKNYAIVKKIEAFIRRNSQAQMVTSLDTQCYFSLMANAAAMVGNSSSGIIEAASFRLPVVNIGIRQRGRITGANVVHCSPNRGEIASAIQRALALDLRTLVNPYGDGDASRRIVEQLRTTPLGTELLCKRFHDLP